MLIRRQRYLARQLQAARLDRVHRFGDHIVALIQPIRGAREEGRLEGKLEGQSALLERLLACRLGPLNESVFARLQVASAEDLALWADRILEAPDLAGAFSVQ